MRAVTVRQPWAGCIAAGAKPVENRGRLVRYRGEFAIHAGLAVDSAAYDDPRVQDVILGNPDFRATTGAIVAVADLVDCHEAAPGTYAAVTCCQPWGDIGYNYGPAFHLIMADIRTLPQPVPCRGALLIGWKVPAEAEQLVRAQLARAVAS